MNVQRKRLNHGTVDSTALFSPQVVASIQFIDAPKVNIHGVNVTIGAMPVGADETMRGRFYVVVLPKSIVSDATTFGTWIQNLGTSGSISDHIDGSSMVWGSIAYCAGTLEPFNWTFAPKTSRNMGEGSGIFVIAVMDSLSGIIDSWEATSNISLFSSS